MEDKGDTVLLYFAGHGIPGYLAPSNANGLDTFISAAELKSWLGILDSEKVIIVTDACNAGSLDTVLSAKGHIILMSSQADEKSYTAEFQDGRSGLFSYYILSALNDTNKTDANNDYRISAEEIFSYAEPRTVPPSIEWYNAGLVSNIQHPRLSDQYFGELTLLERLVINTKNEMPSSVLITVDGQLYPLTGLELLTAPDSTHQVDIAPSYTEGDIRYIFTSWNNGDTSTSIAVSGAGIYTADFNREYLLTIISDFGQSFGEGWYQADSLAILSMSSIEEVDKRHIFNGWSGDFSGTSDIAELIMDSPKTVTAEWQTEYLLTIESAYGDPNRGGWYEANTTVNLSALPDQGTFIMQLFNGWSGDVSTTGEAVQFIMDSPKMITATWETDYVRLYLLIGGLSGLISAGLAAFVIRRRTT
jgi:hypothetical protein